MQRGQRSGNPGQRRFQQFMDQDMDSLLKTLSYYVVRAGLADRNSARQEATELLSEVVLEALEHLDRFERSNQPKAWLLGVAAKLIKRKQVHAAKLHRREPLVRDLYENTQERHSDDELFEQLIGYAADTTNTQELESNEAIVTLLAHLSPDDQRVLRLGILCGLDGASLARELGISAVAARVRMHRASNRLRDAHTKVKDQENGD